MPRTTRLHTRTVLDDGSWWLHGQVSYTQEHRGGDPYTGLNTEAYDEEHATDRAGGSAVWTSDFAETHLCDLYWEEEFGFLMKDLPTLRFILLPNELRRDQMDLIQNGDALIKFLECMTALKGTKRIPVGCADELNQLFFSWWSRGAQLKDLVLITQTLNYLSAHMRNGMRMPDEWFGIHDSLRVMQKAFLPIAQTLINKKVEALLQEKMAELKRELSRFGSELLGGMSILLSVKSDVSASIMPTEHDLDESIEQMNRIAGALGMPDIGDISSMMDLGSSFGDPDGRFGLSSSTDCDNCEIRDLCRMLNHDELSLDGSPSMQKLLHHPMTIRLGTGGFNADEHLHEHGCDCDVSCEHIHRIGDLFGGIAGR